MQLCDFTYNLPKSAIAQLPPKVRGGAKLLVLSRSTGKLTDAQYPSIVDYLKSGDVLVLNDTKVIKARLIAQTADGGDQELVLLEKHGRDSDTHHHRVLYRGHLEAGDKLRVGEAVLSVDQVEEGGFAVVSADQDIEELAEAFGKVPLPPYMKRDATREDELRYQTVFAQTQGSVAAPTASLNMTEELLTQLHTKGVVICYLTLHVGLGTFLPIRVDDITQHIMHSEYYEIPGETARAIQAAKQSGGRVVALGTTVARTLEYAATQIPDALPNGETLHGEADIFIYPGYEFQLVDGLITNFHAPKSTVLMLTAAFAGWDHLQAAYAHALDQGYTFLSYGDSMLIL